MKNVDFLSLFVVLLNKIIVTLFIIEVCYCCVFNWMNVKINIYKPLLPISFAIVKLNGLSFGDDK